MDLRLRKPQKSRIPIPLAIQSKLHRAAIYSKCRLTHYRARRLSCDSDQLSGPLVAAPVCYSEADISNAIDLVASEAWSLRVILDPFKITCSRRDLRDLAHYPGLNSRISSKVVETYIPSDPSAGIDGAKPFEGIGNEDSGHDYTSAAIGARGSPVCRSVCWVLIWLLGLILWVQTAVHGKVHSSRLKNSQCD